MFDQYDAVLLGITVDNIPTLFSWTNQMGNLWFPVLSDFWPHGDAAKKYGVLRSDGTSERALFVIDKKGIRGPERNTLVKFLKESGREVLMI
jgi:peroxiredoxin (alkyl hydroperoxide reductase subunit C)